MTCTQGGHWPCLCMDSVGVFFCGGTREWGNSSSSSKSAMLSLTFWIVLFERSVDSPFDNFSTMNINNVFDALASSPPQCLLSSLSWFVGSVSSHFLLGDLLQPFFGSMTGNAHLWTGGLVWFAGTLIDSLPWKYIFVLFGSGQTHVLEVFFLGGDVAWFVVRRRC